MTAFTLGLTRLSNWMAALAAVAVSLLVLHVTIDVIMRYFFNAPLAGTILYVASFYMVAIAFLPQALTEKDGAQISVDLLYDYFPPAVRRAVLSLGYFLTVVAAGLLAVRTGQEALSKYALGTFSIEGQTRIITWPSYFLPPLGFGLMTLVAFCRFLLSLSPAAPEMPRTPVGGETGDGETML